MVYNEEALRRTTGQALMNNLNKAFQIFRQEERYESYVMDQYDVLSNVKEKKSNWKMRNAAKKPALWMVFVSVILTVGALGMYIAGMGDMLIPCVMIAFSPCVFVLYPDLLHKIAKSIKKKLHIKIGFWGSVLISLIPYVLMVVFGKGRGFGLLCLLLGLGGLYVILGQVDCAFINKEKRNQELNEHFAKIDAEAALELNKRLAVLQSFRASDQMAFAKATVPATFHSSETLGRLIRVMEDGAIYNLPNGIAAYQQIEHMTYMEMQAAAQARAQEAAAREQQAQTAVLRRQSADAAAHNRDMRDQARRANETLNDMRREQKEHNAKVEHFYDDMRY